jgi:hypothetical protein
MARGGQGLSTTLLKKIPPSDPKIPPKKLLDDRFMHKKCGVSMKQVGKVESKNVKNLRKKKDVLGS